MQLTRFMKKLKNIICIFLALFFLIQAAPSAHAATDLTWDDFTEIISSHTINTEIPPYRTYLSTVPSNKPDAEIVIEAEHFARYDEMGLSAEPELFDDFEGMEGISVLTGESAVIEYDVMIEEAGLYEILFEYYPVEGKSSAIQRSIFLDGELPYNELAMVEFSRIWQNLQVINQPDSSNIIWEKDNQGNDLRPRMVETPEWISQPVYDSSGYISQPLSVYFPTGNHTLTIYSLREPMLLRRIILTNREPVQNYEEALARRDSLGAKDTSGQLVQIQAQNSNRTSSQMLYPIQDQSSPAVIPVSAKYLLNNTIGGNSWRFSGQWIEWDFTVPETGYYELTVHYRQNFRRGVNVSRNISINGETPFTEVSDYGFAFTRNWRMDRLSDESGTPFKFYLEEGSTHTLRMQAVLGDFGDIISNVREAVYDLNAIYRSVISRTGRTPDRFADYQIARTFPNLTADMTNVHDRLTWALDEMRRVGGASSERERILISMRDQLSLLINDNELFPRHIGSFRENIRACGTWLNDSIEQPLQLDSIYFHSSDTPVPSRNNNVFHIIWHEITRLFYSFIIDYNQIGNVANEGDVITLWIGSGRDQANVVKTLIEERFSRSTGINVNDMLVDMNTLLQASLAGQGPDVAIQVAGDLPMNFGLRGSVVDLRSFEGFDEVRGRFAESAMEPYEYGGKTFALPETQVFPMMFYRKDILADLDIQLPNTWNDVYVAISELSFNHMEFGMLPNEQAFTMLLYQNGGEYYNKNRTRSALDTEEALNAFRIYTEFFTDFKLDRNTSVEERFRTGEAPIIIADYTFYNTLQISAPDLKGVWGFAPVPGTIQADGSVDRSVSSNGGGALTTTSMIGVFGGGGSATVMMDSTDMKDQVWEFMKWWTSTETQVLFGREMESLMGPAARVPTANREAFSLLPWPAADYRALNYQFQSVYSIPQVPGGYYTFRNVNNAFYAVTTPAADRPGGIVHAPMPREALMDRVILINDEIRSKRIEFGLQLD
ncbi:MAG: extracellular solute-binding protein [Oscillospiraceae bacterium]|jgi:ABC-type glycerol-3-phosphate transport system substrate-binding protein|nr:extracellular solute-binding protein [Oscillospiraceae bacterium]